MAHLYASAASKKSKVWEWPRLFCAFCVAGEWGGTVNSNGVQSRLALVYWIQSGEASTAERLSEIIALFWDMAHFVLHTRPKNFHYKFIYSGNLFYFDGLWWSETARTAAEAIIEKDGDSFLIGYATLKELGHNCSRSVWCHTSLLRK